MSGSEVSRILRDLANEMERHRLNGVETEGPSTSVQRQSLARHPLEAEVCRIFAPYTDRTTSNRHVAARRRSSYTRSYFCLSNTDQMVAPTAQEKDILSAAGLGEQRLTFFGDENSADEFKCHILTAYPKLKECGGFDILRLSGMTRSKKLSLMPCPRTGYTIKSVKTHIKSALIYVRPMQKSIDKTPTEPESVVCGPKEKCLICAEDVLFNQLKDHVKNCRGVAPRFFSERLFCQVCDEPTQPATLEEISDVTFKEKLRKIKEAVTVKEAKAAIDEAEDCLAIIGAWRSITSLKQRDIFVQSAINFFVEGRLRVALQQFVEGLKTLGLLEEMRTLTDLFRCMFLEDMKPLKASDISALFHVRFSTPGTHARELESKTVCFWRDWLIDVEEGECSPMTLENVLVFASGSSTIPPNGFLLQPTIEIFPEESGKIFPEANTCNIVLKLPVHNNYDSFKAHMCNAVLWAPTFGVA